MPSFETHFYIGIVGSLMLIGARDFLLKLSVMLSSAGISVDLYTTDLGWWVGTLPSLVLTMLLNNLYFFHSNPKTYTTRRGGKLHLNKGFLKTTILRFAVSSAGFSILSFFAFLGVSGFFYLMFDRNALPRLISTIALGFSFAIMSFALSIILLGAILLIKAYLFKGPFKTKKKS